MNVSIRPLREEDAYVSVNWRNDPQVFRYTGNTYSHTITIESELEWIRKVMANPNDLRCAIEVDGEYVGNIYLNEIDTGIGQYHIFIGNRDFWGKGVAKSASCLIIQEGFSRLKLERIMLHVRIANERAYHLYIKLGFVEDSRDDTWITMSIINPINK